MKQMPLLILFILFLTGCSVLHKPQSAISTYALGMPHLSLTEQVPKQLQLHRRSLLITDATAPAWLDNTAIHYRLLYHNPAQSYAYASSRWIAAPATLLTQQIRNRIVTSTPEQVLKDSGTAKADYALQIELDEFTQLFDATDSSHVVVSLRVSLIERNSRKLFAQKDFSTIESTPSADAAGAVFALNSASKKLINELVNWLIVELPPA
ncbi:MAG: ABC-type transport auxiliary lipoprotein family protein [Nitrosomonas sp.]|uniref:ABC-type transport auxiliary lipoprotein family protein n=1 Tax=Nitrosomonas sp. TaxID=42353 RepID=UPI0025E91A89|nr:ABC-type transport auxiliary lipoprotein family protein [Nitrosomonas sp.]MBY0475525.1 ABC-type transport auxiliary lipoprotein family protein [Nitrosomonas sp.]